MQTFANAVHHPRAIPFLEWATQKGILDLQEAEENVSFPDLVARAIGGRAEGGGEGEEGSSLEVVKWLMQKGLSWRDEAVIAAAQTGQREVLEWARGEGLFPTKMDPGVISEFARSGDLEFIWWAQEIGIPITFDNSVGSAVGSGHLHVVKWLWEEKRERYQRQKKGDGETEGVGRKGEGVEEGEGGRAGRRKEDEGRAEDESRKKDEYVKENYLHSHHRAAHISAARAGHLGVLKFLAEKGILNGANSTVTIISAASSGRFEMVRWLMGREKGGWASPSILRLAARRGDLEMLKWGREKGCPWTSGVYEDAGRAGRVDIMAWAKEEGCPWDDDVISNIFANQFRTGNEKSELAGVLQWVYEQGFQIKTEDVFWGALQKGMLGVLEWLAKKEGAPRLLEIMHSGTFRIAAKNGSTHVLTWLKNLVHVIDSIGAGWLFFEGAVNHHVKVLRWAKKNGAVPEPSILVDLLECTHGVVDFNVLRWYRENGIHVSMDNMKKIAQGSIVGYQKWKIIRWAIKEGVLKVDSEFLEVMDGKTKVLYEKWTQTREGLKIK
jgi:hypothetical protein